MSYHHHIIKNYYRCVSLFCSHDFLPFLPLNAGVVGLRSDPVVPAGMMTMGEMVTLNRVVSFMRYFQAYSVQSSLSGSVTAYRRKYNSISSEISENSKARGEMIIKIIKCDQLPDH